MIWSGAHLVFPASNIPYVLYSPGPYVPKYTMFLYIPMFSGSYIPDNIHKPSCFCLAHNSNNSNIGPWERRSDSALIK